jgi:succinoglycan biosynthesis transport protein ExoP
MNIIQFIRIIWARALLIGACTVFTAIGGALVLLLVPPRYEATSRVMLALLKPDPVTGQGVVDSRNVGAYIETQRELIKDYRVTGAVVDRLGWLTDPGRMAQYQQRSAGDSRDFRRWLAQEVAERTSAKVVSGTIFEISFTSQSPQEAKVGAEVLREAYIDYTLTARRQDAARNAQWYATQAENARKQAEAAELAKAAFERENGILLQSDGGGSQQDIDSARLAALVSQAATAPAAVAGGAVGASGASLQLAQLDAEISENAGKLGPNHPQMQQMRARRALVAKVVEEERRGASAGAGTAAAVGAISRALQEQKSRVIAQRDKVERLRQLQSEVELRREQYKKTAERAAELSLEAGVADSGMSMLGVVVTPEKPSFPNKTLILGGSLALGGALGLVLAVLIELLNRRIRGIEDLDMQEGINCLAVIAPSARKRRSDKRRAKKEPPAGATVGASA